MDADDRKKGEAQRQDLLRHLDAAQEALRLGLQIQGFGSIPQGHLERALAHVQEAHTAIVEINRARTVSQLVNDLIRVQRVMDDATRGQSQKM